MLLLVEALRVEIIFPTASDEEQIPNLYPRFHRAGRRRPCQDFSVLLQLPCHQPAPVSAPPVVRIPPQDASPRLASTGDRRQDGSDHAVSRRRGTPAMSRADADPPIQEDPRFVACANRCDPEELEPMRAGEDTRPQFA